MKEIYLVRHGNTFESNENPVWLGSKQDLELTEFGRKQISNIVDYFEDKKIEKIYCANLKRTKTTAEILGKALNLKIEENKLLREIDFGIWGGLSNNEIIEKFGDKEINNWNNYGIFPKHLEKIPEILISEILDLVKNINENKVILVSSQIRIRYFLSLIPNELSNRLKNNDYKVATASISKLICENNEYKVVFWNKRFL